MGNGVEMKIGIVEVENVNKKLGGEKENKMEIKTLALVQLAIVLCSLFLVALPAIAAEQNQEMQKASASEITTASGDDYVLGVYGNANEDDNIDMRDLTYVKLIFFGKKPETELADAKYDGKINPLDFIQIKLIIVGKEKELTLVDSADRIVTVKKPIERIIPFSSYVTEVMRSLKATDKIVGTCEYVVGEEAFFPEFSDFPNLGSSPESCDYEKIVELQPDVFFLYTEIYDKILTRVESLVPDVTVIRIDCDTPDDYIEEVTKLAYILDRKDEAEELLDFREECLNQIKEVVETLSEDKKPRVLNTWPEYYPTTYYVTSRPSPSDQQIVTAGGINIGADLEEAWGGFVTVDPEWVLVQNPEIILGSHYSLIGYQVDKPTEAELKAARDKIMLQPGWEHIAAVESGKVYLIYSKIIDFTAHHFIGTAYMAKLFHLELFEDFDPQAIHQEYLTRFQGLDFDVCEDGVFVYPYPPLES